MVSYFILTPPGAVWNDDRAQFVADRFSALALVFPALWLIGHRLWVAGIVVATLQIGSLVLLGQPGFLVSGIALKLALGLLVAMEGPVFLAQNLTRRGWTLRDIVPADSLETAEDVYFAGKGDDEADQRATQLPMFSGQQKSSQTVLGLFDFGEDR